MRTLNNFEMSGLDLPRPIAPSDESQIGHDEISPGSVMS